MATPKEHISRVLAEAIDKAHVERVKQALKERPNLEVAPQGYLPPLFQVVQRLNGFSIVAEGETYRPVTSRDEWLQEDKAKNLLEIFQLLLAQNPNLNMKYADSTLFQFMDGGCKAPRLHHPAREPLEKAIQAQKEAAKPGTRTQPSGTMLNQFLQAQGRTTAATTPQGAETPKQMLERLKVQFPGAELTKYHEALKAQFPGSDSIALWLLCNGVDIAAGTSVQLSVSGSSSNTTITSASHGTSNSSQFSVTLTKR